MDITDIVASAEARLRAEGHWPPAPEAGVGYDLNDPHLRKELLSMDEVHFRIHPLPPEIQSFIDSLGREISDSEQDVICDYLDKLYGLAPDFGTSRGDDGRSIWVFEHEDSYRRKMEDPAFRRRQREPLDPALITAHDLQELKNMMRRLGYDHP